MLFGLLLVIVKSSPYMDSSFTTCIELSSDDASTYVEFSIIIEVMYGMALAVNVADIGFGDSGFVMSMI